MESFIHFWRDCVREGWDVGEGTFYLIDGLCVVVGAFLWVFKLKQHRKWGKTEERVVKLAGVVFLLSFVIAAIAVAPFSKFKEAHELYETATNRIAKLEKDLDSQRLLTDLTQLQIERLQILGKELPKIKFEKPWQPDTLTGIQVNANFSLAGRVGLTTEIDFNVTIGKGRILKLTSDVGLVTSSLSKDGKSGTCSFVPGRQTEGLLIIVVSEKTIITITSPSLDKAFDYRVE
jgi:hypothetical protein